jgi:hypothetical protein
MVLSASLFEFVLNRLVELVKSRVCFIEGFKEAQMRKVANVVHDFTGLSVSTQHMYNHVRKWRVK